MNVRRVVRVLKTPVTLLLLLGILGYGAYWGYKQVTLDPARPDATCVMQDVGKTLTPDKVTVRVFNGGETGNHAKTTRNFLIAFDFHVISYNNADEKVTTTTVIGNSADDPEVKLVAQMFRDSVTKGDGRADHVVDVIVPTQYQDLSKNTDHPVTSIAVDGPVCLPVINTATESASPTPDQSTTPSPNSTPTATKKSTKKK